MLNLNVFCLLCFFKRFWLGEHFLSRTIIKSKQIYCKYDSHKLPTVSNLVCKMALQLKYSKMYFNNFRKYIIMLKCELK